MMRQDRFTEQAQEVLADSQEMVRRSATRSGTWSTFCWRWCARGAGVGRSWRDWSGPAGGH